jgi:hypothetical protein
MAGAGLEPASPRRLFGFSSQKEHQHLVEAVVEDAVITSYPRRRAERMTDANAEVARTIREMAYAAIERAESQILILGQMSTLEKVGTFLLLMVERLSNRAGELRGPLGHAMLEGLVQIAQLLLPALAHREVTADGGHVHRPPGTSVLDDKPIIEKGNGRAVLKL